MKTRHFLNLLYELDFEHLHTSMCECGEDVDHGIFHCTQCGKQNSHFSQERYDEMWGDFFGGKKRKGVQEQSFRSGAGCVNQR
mgnify:CR=1 FL=1